MRNNIIRCLVNVCRVTLAVVQWDHDFTEDEFDGLVLSDGPGDPQKCATLIGHARTLTQNAPGPQLSEVVWGTRSWALQLAPRNTR